MTDQEILILLNMIPGLGSITLNKLLSIFHTPQNILKASDRELEKIIPKNRKIIPKILKWEEHIDLKQEISLIEKHKISLITIFQNIYPKLLKEIHSPPPLLYIKGNPEALQANRTIAIVGSRRASIYGIRNTTKLAKGLGFHKFSIISGLASGIDSAAHRGALESNTYTIAVLGNGLEKIYPQANKKLASNIIEKKGALISELPMSTPPLKQNFPKRNRIISGLSQGVIITEAYKQSGALITTDFALEQGRQVFSMPGKIDSLASQGTNNLIKQGAKPVTELNDILEEFDMPPYIKSKEESPLPLPSLTPKEKLIYNYLDDERTVEEIITATQTSVSETMTTLLSLELKQLAKRLPGKKYTKI